MSAEEFTYLPVHVYIMPSSIYENFSWWGTELSILLGKKNCISNAFTANKDKVSW